MQEVVNTLGPIAQLVFAVVLAVGFLLIQWRNKKITEADRTEAATDAAIAAKHQQIQNQTDLHFDGPVMATHRMVTDLTRQVGDLNHQFSLFSETMKLRDVRNTEIVADQFRLLRSIEDKAEEIKQTGDAILREFSSKLPRQR